MTLFQEIQAAGIEYDNHETDLYVPDNPTVRAILANHGKKVDGWNVQPFRSNIDGTPWLDVPFAYDPAWERKVSR